MPQLKNRPKLADDTIKELKKGQNLLAFSAGVDSTALFFILMGQGIEFDIAIVNYNTREQSLKEIEYAKKLSKKYDKKLYIKDIKKLSSSNFEHNARVARYEFFDEIINKKSYTHLITAHQLNDKLEWFLMQFTKGAGVVELLGFESIKKRDNYTLVRPLVEIAKEELLEFLELNSIKYFIDKSNLETKYRRNYFRKNFSDKLIKEYKEGIKKSFRYLQNDKNELFKLNIYKKIGQLYILKSTKNSIKDIRMIDAIFKKLGYLLSKKQKDEIVSKKDVVISDRFAVVLQDGFIYISPFLKVKMEKKFKERCRVLKIPPKIRGYIYKKKIGLSERLEPENL